MDQVRQLTGVDAAVAQYGVTGRGVIVALLDRGIDWKNADFRRANGTTRIAYIFDMTDNTGAHAPGNTYGVGTIYTRQQIDDALKNGTPLATRDAVGHGTTTAGIAAGGGRNNAKYRGIAPDSTIIVVKITTEGAPAHDAEPAEAPFYDPALIPVAIDFVRDKAHELGLPAVMLLNLGVQGGPTDGTSDLARKIDATVGPGIPGSSSCPDRETRAGWPIAPAATSRRAARSRSRSASSIPTRRSTSTSSIRRRIDSTSRSRVRPGRSALTPSPATNANADTEQTSDFLYYHYGNTARRGAAKVESARSGSGSTAPPRRTR